MEVNNSYIEFLLKELYKEENSNIELFEEDLMINSYLTLLSLSNLEFSEDIEKKEKDQIDDFLRKLNNLKVKIQLKRKPEETNKLAEELITQYYENVNILSIYIKDGVELENVIHTMDAKTLTKLIDKVTKDKMNKEYSKEERNKKRIDLNKLLPQNNYYIENNIIYIKTGDNYEEISINDFISMYSYLLNPDNYNKTYSNKSSKRNHQLIIANLIKLLVVKDKKQELDKSIIPLLITYILSQDIDNNIEIDASKFQIENIKITELYSLASLNQETEQSTETRTKWRNISIPNDYLISKIKDMITKGMYYFRDDSFVLENIENKTSDFKVSIKIDELKEFIKQIIEKKLKDNKVKTK